MVNKKEDIYVSVGRRIKKVRVEKNIEKRDLAERLNMSVKDIEAIETGKSRITMDDLFLISNILQTEMNYFITGIPNNHIIIASNVLDKYIETFKFVNSLSPKQKQIFSNMLNKLSFSPSEKISKKII